MADTTTNRIGRVAGMITAGDGKERCHQDDDHKKQRSPAAMAVQRLLLKCRMLPPRLQYCVVLVIAILSWKLFSSLLNIHKFRTLPRTDDVTTADEYDASMAYLAESRTVVEPNVYNGTYPAGRHPRIVLLSSTYTAPPDAQNPAVIRNGKRVFTYSMLKGYEFQLARGVSRVAGDFRAKHTRRLVAKYDPLTHFASVKQHPPASPMDKGSCHASAKWQRGHRPTCNIIHEVMSSFHPENLGATGVAIDSRQDFLRKADKNKLLFKSERRHWQFVQEDIDRHGHAMLAAGGAFRHVWMIREFDGTKRALKTLRVDSERKDFDIRSFDRHRRDAMSMEQLTKSPLVVDIFGHCSNSALFMWGDKGDLSDIFQKMPGISELELLQIAHNVSLSISHAHHFDKQGRPTMAHTDIKPNQFLFEDGYYKLTDFNRVRFLKWDAHKHEICGFQVGKNGGIWRSPEEYEYEAETEKVDVFSLGNVLFFLLAREDPWEHVDKRSVAKRVMKGQKAPVPDDIASRRESSLFVGTMMHAMEMAFTTDPRKRPSAKEVADLIQVGVDKMMYETSK